MVSLSSRSSHPQNIVLKTASIPLYLVPRPAKVPSRCPSVFLTSSRSLPSSAQTPPCTRACECSSPAVHSFDTAPLTPTTQSFDHSLSNTTRSRRPDDGADAFLHPDPLSIPPVNFHPYTPIERSNVGIPPSLWMSPTSTHPPSPALYSPLTHLSIPQNGIVPPDPSPLSGHLHVSPSTTASLSVDSKSAILSDLFSDDLFGTSSNGQGPSSFTSPRLSGSPDIQSTALPSTETDPEKLAKQDPLATQVWKMFARTKANLPHAHRMENITWRMMALALKKKKEQEETPAAPGSVRVKTENTSSSPFLNQLDPSNTHPATEERGRPFAKGKGKVQVIGFDGTNQDGTEDDEYVLTSNVLLGSRDVNLLSVASQWTGGL